MKLIKILLRTVAAISFILMLGSLESNFALSIVLMVVWFACTYLAGGCYELFYKKKGERA